MIPTLEKYNHDFPPEAQSEWRDFLESEREAGFPSGRKRQRSLGRLVTHGEGQIVVTKGAINGVKNQLARLGI